VIATPRPLDGLRVAVTRSASQQAGLADPLIALGATVVALPTIDFAPPESPERVAAAVAALHTYDWVLFTSTNGVDRFLDAVDAEGRGVQIFNTVKVACVGSATARRLAARGVQAHLTPESYVAEGLLAALAAAGLGAGRVLLPRAAVGREVLPEQLRAQGAQVDVVPVYRTVTPVPDAKAWGQVQAGAVTVITFTASSTVTRFVAQLLALYGPEVLAQVQASAVAACIGPVTAETARAAGFSVEVEARRFTVAGLVEALVRWRAH
jgi:uroporphyrinogen III methyltransferase/synthase